MPVFHGNTIGSGVVIVTPDSEGTLDQVLTSNGDGTSRWTDKTGGGGIGEAPTDGKQYGRQSEAWTEIDVLEAPQDSQQYARFNGAWQVVAAGGGGVEPDDDVTWSGDHEFQKLGNFDHLLKVTNTSATSAAAASVELTSNGGAARMRRTSLNFTAPYQDAMFFQDMAGGDIIFFSGGEGLRIVGATQQARFGKGAHFGVTEQTASIVGNAATLDMGLSNHWSVNTSSADGTVTLSFTPPQGSTSGTVILTQGATPRNINWPGGVAAFLGPIPDWDDPAEANKTRIISWRWNRTQWWLMASGASN